MRRVVRRMGTAAMLAGLVACSSGCSPGVAADRAIRITGSDTMVNLVQAWAEAYATVRPAVSVQVAGGGSGVGIAGLINGTLDVAAASREMTQAEIHKLTVQSGAAPLELVVGLDALAIYVHRSNALDSISLDALANIYGEGGRVQRWSQLGDRNPRCTSDAIIRVGRQNSSGTYTYFRDVVLGTTREFGMGSIDQSGSKDVVNLVSRTPCAIGYSGMAFATSTVKTLGVRPRGGGLAVAPSAASVWAHQYPLARPLYLLTPAAPGGEVRRFLRWVLGPDGQRVVSDLGFVPVAADDRQATDRLPE